MSSIIWLTDNSRRSDRLTKCEMRGYFKYHAGEYGYGWDGKALALPLATGTYVHDAARPILQFLQNEDTMPPDDIVRQAIEDAQEKYRKVAAVRGIEDRIDETGEQAFILTEQQVLIEGLIWMFVAHVLPGLLAADKVVSVEEEFVNVVGCTCGAGDGFGTLKQHEDRDCQGIGWQSRLDFITESRTSAALTYHEIKTKSYALYDWREQYENDPQLMSGNDSASAMLQREIDYNIVHALVKGSRRVDKFTKIRQQGSPLCYAWVKEPNPPMEDGDIAWSYEYQDVDGRNHRLGKGYKKTPIWHVNFPDKPEWMSNAEYWVRSLPVEAVAQCYSHTEPLPRNRTMSYPFWQNVIAHEARWVDKLSALSVSLAPWESQEFQDLLTATIERSWNCYPWNGSRCPYTFICFRQEGWQDPVGAGKVVYRRPHHTPELDQMKERGLLPPDAGWGEDDEEDDDA